MSKIARSNLNKKTKAKLQAFNHITPLPAGTLVDRNIQNIKATKEFCN